MLQAAPNPTAVQSLPVQRELQFAACERVFGRLAADGLPIDAIPQLHGAAAVFALGYRAFKVAVVERVVLDLDGEALVVRIERRAARHRPRREDAAELKAQIVMQPARGMFL